MSAPALATECPNPSCGAPGATWKRSSRGLLVTCQACGLLDADHNQVYQLADVEDLIRVEMKREKVRRVARERLEEQERPPFAFPEILTLRERLARPRSAVLMRIEEYLPRASRVLFAAQYKAGKTTLTGNFVRSLVDGDPFLGRFAATPIEGSVALLDCEMAPSKLDDWLRDQAIRNDDRVVPIPLRGALASFNLLDAEARARWAVRLRELGASYLILDCLRPVLDVLGLDEHRDAGRFLVAFDALLTEAEISEAAVVHHMGHNGERSRGDSRLRDWPDVEWSLVRESEDPSSPRYFKAYGRDVDQPEALLAWDQETRRLTIAGGSRRDAAARVVLDAVLDAIDNATSALSVRGIQTALDGSEHPRDAVRAAIRQGVRDGEIATERGARGAILHRRGESACGTVRDRAPHGASECAAAYREPHARTLVEKGSSVRTGTATVGEV